MSAELANQTAALAYFERCRKSRLQLPTSLLGMPMTSAVLARLNDNGFAVALPSKSYGIGETDQRLVALYWNGDNVTHVASIGSSVKLTAIAELPGMFPQHRLPPPQLLLCQSPMTAVVVNTAVSSLSSMPVNAVHVTSLNAVPKNSKVEHVVHALEPLTLATALDLLKRSPDLCIIKFDTNIFELDAATIFQGLKQRVTILSYVGAILVQLINAGDTSHRAVIAGAGLNDDVVARLKHGYLIGRCNDDNINAAFSGTACERVIGDCRIRKKDDGYHLISPEYQRLTNFVFDVTGFVCDSDGNNPQVSFGVGMAGGKRSRDITMPLSAFNHGRGDIRTMIWAKVAALDQNYDFVFSAGNLPGFTWLDIIHVFGQHQFKRQLARLGYDGHTQALVFGNCEVGNAGSYTCTGSGANIYAGLCKPGQDQWPLVKAVFESGPLGLGFVGGMLAVATAAINDCSKYRVSNDQSLFYILSQNPKQGWLGVITDISRCLSGNDNAVAALITDQDQLESGYDGCGNLPVPCRLLVPGLHRPARPVIAGIDYSCARTIDDNDKLLVVVNNDGVAAPLSPETLSEFRAWLPWLCQRLIRKDLTSYGQLSLYSVYNEACIATGCNPDPAFMTMFNSRSEAAVIDDSDSFCQKLRQLIYASKPKWKIAECQSLGLNDETALGWYTRNGDVQLLRDRAITAVNAGSSWRLLGDDISRELREKDYANASVCGGKAVLRFSRLAWHSRVVNAD